jgi:hypothetical protein
MQSIERVRARIRARTTVRAVAVAAGAAVGAVGLCATAVVAIGTHPVVEPLAATGATPPGWRSPQQEGLPRVPDEPVDLPVPDVPLAWPEVVVSGPGGGAAAVASRLASGGIPATALAAYRHAEAVLGRSRPGCRLDWPVVAAIGRVESNHGRFGGAVLTADGRSVPPVRGPRLDGGQFALVRDTEDGRLDGDPVLDRAVGAMQFLPGTWRTVGADGNGDGTKDPDNIYDAAVGTGVYLCSGSTDLTDPVSRRAAIFRYNHSQTYVDFVLSVADSYRAGVTVADSGTAPDGAAVPDGANTGPRPATRSTPPKSTGAAATGTATRTTTAATPTATPAPTTAPTATTATTTSPPAAPPSTTTPATTSSGATPGCPLILLCPLW